MTPTVDTRPILVGEANPYGADPRYALYCEPRNSAGGRLCFDILQMSRGEYIKTFQRVNLCPSKWSVKVARARAADLLKEPAALILCGSKVCAAFGLRFEPFALSFCAGVRAGVPAFREMPIVMIPHPSGLCRLWHAGEGQAANFGSARALIQACCGRAGS